MDLEKYLGFIENDFKDKFLLFKELLLNANKICNLTSISDEKGIISKKCKRR